MVVRLKKNQLDLFRRKARHNPNEIYAIMVGRAPTPHLVEVVEFHYPPLVASTPSYVECSDEEWQKVAREANSYDMRIVGAVHSHPSWPPIMSPQDMALHRDSNDVVTGIVEATNGRTRVAFWTAKSSLPCKLEYV